MITSRIELQVSMEKMAQGIEIQKSLFQEGGPYYGVTKGYRIFQAYFSGQRNIIAVEIDFENLGEFEAVHQAMLSKVTADDWATYYDVFDSKATWTHWIKHEAEGETAHYSG